MKLKSCTIKDCIRPAKWALFGPDPKAPRGAVLAAVFCGQHKPTINRRGLGRLIPFNAIAIKENDRETR